MQHSKTQSGFTLIEMIVVLFILAISIKLAVLSFGSFGKDRQIQTSAHQLKEYIKFIQFKAILESQPYSILFLENSYYAVSAHGEKIKTQYISPKLAPYLEIDSNNKKRINIFSNGHLTPFKLSYYLKPNQPYLTVYGKYFGKISIQ